MPEFMVVLRGAVPEKDQSVADLRRRYSSWVSELRQDKRYRGGSPFKPGGKLLTSRREFVYIRETPSPSVDWNLSGYFVIEAKTLDEAIEVARTCPALSRGDSVEVLELDNR